MGIKRISYLLLTYGYISLMVYFGWLGSDGSIGGSILGAFMSLLLGVAVTMIVMLLSFIGRESLPDIGDDAPFTFGFLTHKWKTIYYSDLGYFHIRTNSKRVIIYKQGYLMVKRLCEVPYNGSIEELREKIKKELDYIYAEELRIIKKRKELENWDGYIDIKSKRDDKIKKVLQ